MVSFLKKMYGNFQSSDEVKKFITLGITFFLIIGVYWTLRPMKDALFASIVGAQYQPIGKILSMFAVFPIVMFYSKLIDWFSRDKVFYILLSFYAITAMIFTWCFLSPSIGIVGNELVPSPARTLGWVWYLWVESFGSLVVALFWAFTADITAPDSAKRGYPLIVLFGQIGNIVGPGVLTPLGNSYFNSPAPIVAICGLLMVAIAFMIWIFNKVVPASQRVGYKAEGSDTKKGKKAEAGFFEGLKLLVKTPYLLSIFFIIFFFELIVTVFDFLFKINAAESFTDVATGIVNVGLLNTYLGGYAMWTGVVACLCVLLGINNITRKLGMAPSLLLLPIMILVAIFMTKFYGVLGVLFWIMVFAKAVNYALNQPTLKQLYIPTSEDAKYKSQAWIEMFGSRASKGGASGFNLLRNAFVQNSGQVAGAAAFGTIFMFMGVGLVALWIPVAIYAARKFNKAVDSDTLVC